MGKKDKRKNAWNSIDDDARIRIMSPSLVMRDRRKLIIAITLIVVAAWITYWWLPIGPDTWAIWAVMSATGVLAYCLGYRLQKLRFPVFATALGLSWRIGVLWVLLAAIVEWFMTEFTPIAVITSFPIVLVPTLLIVWLGIILGFASRLVWRQRLRNVAIRKLLPARPKDWWTLVRRDLLPVLGILIGIASVFFAPGRSSDVDLQKKLDGRYIRHPIQESRFEGETSTVEDTETEEN